MCFFIGHRTAAFGESESIWFVWPTLVKLMDVLGDEISTKYIQPPEKLR